MRRVLSAGRVAILRRCRSAGLVVASGATGLMASPAFAQRPPSPSQGPPKMSVEAAWAWLMARPGVVVAIVVIIALVAFMFMSRDKSKKT